MDFAMHWLAAIPGYAAPLLLASLGLIINERAGVLNLGAEGMMACGALAGALACLASGSATLGALSSIVAGAGLALIFGFVVVYLRANQVVTGLVIVALGTGITGVLGRDIVGTSLPGFQAFDAVSIQGWPFISTILSGQNALTLVSLLVLLVVWACLFKTLTGLRLRAVGEDPATADASGINVLRTRLLAVVSGGALCGLAGGYLTLASSYIWVEGMIAGRGWIAVGLVIFARWRPMLALLGAMLFGAIEALIPRVQATGSDVPIYLLLMLPYVATLGVLVLTSIIQRRASDEPASLGIAYSRQDRH